MATATQIAETPVSPQRFAPEFELLMACCGRTRQHEIKSLLTPYLDWERVLESADHHRLIPVLHSALTGKNGVPSTLRARAHKHAWRVLRFTAELMKIAQCFERHGIEFLAHKGPALAQLLYGDQAMRQFGDLDIIVRPRDFRPANQALIELGYDPRLSLSPRQQEFLLRTGYECAFGLNSERNLVELQWQILPRFCAINFDIDALFRRSRPIGLDGFNLKILGHEDLLLALCVHAAKHEWTQLGMLRDIATLASFYLDWNWIISEARRLGILNILQVSLLAADNLFDDSLSAHLPIRTGACFELASAVVARMQHNHDSHTESMHYFRAQLQIRERWRDRARFVWRLATTPSVQEWQSIPIPDGFFSLYHGVRVARLMKRFLT